MQRRMRRQARHGGTLSACEVPSCPVAAPSRIRTEGVMGASGGGAVKPGGGPSFAAHVATRTVPVPRSRTSAGPAVFILLPIFN
jgi:hypothetical protein